MRKIGVADTSAKAVVSLNDVVFNKSNATKAIPLGQKNNTMKFGNLTVNIESRFHPKKSLYDIFFSIANARLKEKVN